MTKKSILNKYGKRLVEFKRMQNVLNKIDDASPIQRYNFKTEIRMLKEIIGDLKELKD